MENKSTIKATCVLLMIICNLFSQKDSLLFFKKNTAGADSLNTFGTEDKTTKQKDEDNISQLNNDSGLIQKNTYRNIISVESSASFYRVPYRGFFTNQLTGEGELYNVSSNGVNVNYYRKFKRNSNWMWGMSLGYEWMWVRFYDVTRVYNPYDTTNNILKYNYVILPFKEIILDGSSKSTTYSPIYGWEHKMIDYLGVRTFYWEYIKIGYSLSYNKKFNDRWSLFFSVQSVGYVERSISRLSVRNNQANFYIYPFESEGVVLFNSSEGLMNITPLSPIINIFNRVIFNKGDRVPLCAMRYSFKVSYNFLDRHFIGFNLSLQNIFPYHINRLNSYYLPDKTCSSPGCLYLPPAQEPPWEKGYFIIRIYPEIYQQLSISLEYGTRF